VLLIANLSYLGNGLFYAQELEWLTHRLLLEVALERGRIDKVYYCRCTVGENGHGGVLTKGLLGRVLAEHALCAASTYLITSYFKTGYNRLKE
jgi:hypothetical protein